MLGAKARMLLRLMPRVSRFSPMQQIKLNTSAYGTFNRTLFTCCQSGKANLVVHNGSIVMPKRHLAGDHKEDYILHQNSLTEVEKKEIDSSVKKDFEDWVPYGFCPTDKEEDILRYKMFMFSSLTMGIVVFLYVFFHLPPRNNREWVTREAYLEMERRQRLGLPLVDRNLIPADQVLLPSLEELGDDYEIII